MKIKKILTALVLSISFSLAQSVSLTTGWNLMGGVSHNDVNLSKFVISWVYNEGKWSKSWDENFEIDPQQGVWFLFKGEEPYNYTKKQYTHTTLQLKKGWNLVGDINKKFDLYHEDVIYIYAYKNNQWEMNPDIDTIVEYKGYWIYTLKEITLYSNDSSLTPPEINLNKDTLDDSFYISDTDLNNMSINQKKAAVEKILTSLYIGYTKEEMEKLLKGDNTISTILNLLGQSKPSNLQKIESELELYHYHWRYQVSARSLGRMMLLPISKEYIDMWTAYQLVNSKFFSGSLELNTVEDGTAVNLIQTLYKDIASDTPISTMLYNYLDSEEHWRRFRSPEDNTREVLELQMDLFDDSLVPLASLACQNYSYNEDEKNLIIDFNYNYLSIPMFGETIYSCDEFYSAVSKQSEVKTTFISYFVDQYFPLETDEEKTKIIEDIEGLGLTTYKSILFAIIFSDKFVMDSVKVKSIEELYLSNAKKLGFIPSISSFKSFVSIAHDAGQSIMYHKLGRGSDIPTDILSYSTLSKEFKESIMTDIKHNMLNEWDAGWTSDFLESLDFNTKEEMINSLFIHMISRNGDSDEIETFISIFSDYKLSSDYHRSIMVQILLDYISRLPQTYITTKITQN